MNKNLIFKISKVLLFILFCFIGLSMLQQYFFEGFRGRGRGRGRRIPASGRGGRPGRYLNRFRRRNNFRRRRRPWGPSWFQAYPIYDYYYNYFPTIYSCKEGCSPNGNCVSPGNGPNDCVWSSDCWGC